MDFFKRYFLFVEVNYFVIDKIFFIIYLGSRVLLGCIYKFMGWMKFLDCEKIGDVYSFELWICFKKRGDKK